MHETQAFQLFQLFLGDGVSPEAYQPILDAAILEVRQLLISDADAEDARLCYLEAALAFLRYTEITAARDRVACTLAGTVAQNTDSSQKMALAKELVYAYRGLCCSLLTDDIYLFSAI